MPSQTLYPNLQLFLHEYIRHIRDISQLCNKLCQIYEKFAPFFKDFFYGNLPQIGNMIQKMPFSVWIRINFGNC